MSRPQKIDDPWWVYYHYLIAKELTNYNQLKNANLLASSTHSYLNPI